MHPNLCGHCAKNLSRKFAHFCPKSFNNSSLNMNKIRRNISSWRMLSIFWSVLWPQKVPQPGTGQRTRVDWFVSILHKLFQFIYFYLDWCLQFLSTKCSSGFIVWLCEWIANYSRRFTQIFGPFPRPTHRRPNLGMFPWRKWPNWQIHNSVPLIQSFFAPSLCRICNWTTSHAQNTEHSKSG